MDDGVPTTGRVGTPLTCDWANRNSSGGLPAAGHERRGGLVEAVAGNSAGQVLQGTASLETAGLSNGQQTSRSPFAGSAIAETDFAPLRNARSALLLVGSTPACSRNVNRRSACSKRARQILHLPVGIVQMGFGHNKQAPLQSHRPVQQLRTVNESTAKLVPQQEQAGHGPPTHPGRIARWPCAW